MNDYSGPASGLWSLRSLVLAFHSPPDSDFWRAPAQKLPVERADYDIFIPQIRWRIRGQKQSGEVEVIKLDNEGNEPRPAADFTLLRRTASLLTCRPFRPDNSWLAYNLHRYSTLRPFCCPQ